MCFPLENNHDRSSISIQASEKERVQLFHAPGALSYAHCILSYFYIWKGSFKLFLIHTMQKPHFIGEKTKATGQSTQFINLQNLFIETDIKLVIYLRTWCLSNESVCLPGMTISDPKLWNKNQNLLGWEGSGNLAGVFLGNWLCV